MRFFSVLKQNTIKDHLFLHESCILSAFYPTTLNSYVGICHRVKKRVLISHSPSNSRKKHNNSSEGQNKQDQQYCGSF